MTDFGEHFESLLGMRARVCVCVYKRYSIWKIPIMDSLQP